MNQWEPSLNNITSWIIIDWGQASLTTVNHHSRLLSIIDHCSPTWRMAYDWLNINNHDGPLCNQACCNIMNHHNHCWPNFTRIRTCSASSRIVKSHLPLLTNANHNRASLTNINHHNLAWNIQELTTLDHHESRKYHSLTMINHCQSISTMIHLTIVGTIISIRSSMY